MREQVENKVAEFSESSKRAARYGLQQGIDAQRARMARLARPERLERNGSDLLRNLHRGALLARCGIG